MENYCFDQYDHPLLWCDERKKLVERRNAEESLKLWQKKRNDELARIEKDKREYNEMVIKHCPWGRPGGGAPNLDVRMRDITVDGLHPITKYKPKISTTLPPCRVNIPCGGTAQIRSAADRVYITLKDPSNVKAKDKGQVDIELRYNPTPRNKKTQTQSNKYVIVKETATTTTSRKPKSTKMFQENKKFTEGPRWKSGMIPSSCKIPNPNESSFMRSLGWTNKELLKQLDQEAPQDLSDKRNKKQLKQINSSANVEVKRCCALCTCKCPTIQINENSPEQQQFKKSANKKQLANKSGNNKTGGSGLKRGTVSNVVNNGGDGDSGNRMCPRAVRQMNDVNVKGDCKPKEIFKRDRETAKPIRECMITTVQQKLKQKGQQRHQKQRRQKGEEQQKHQQHDQTDSQQGTELVPLLARRRSTHRPVSLCSTDVTKNVDTTTKNRLMTNYDVEYLDELERQIKQKRRRYKLNKEQEEELCNQHFQIFKTFWGRPGHGAPKAIKTKFKLDDLLYGYGDATSTTIFGC